MRKNYLKRIIIASGIGLALFITVQAIINDGEDLLPLLIAIPVMAIVFTYSFRRNLKQHRVNWDTYVLVIEGDTLTTKRDGFPDVVVKANEITSMTEDKQGNIRILTKPNHGIAIPSAIEQREEVLELLKDFGEVKPKKAFAALKTLLAALGVVAASVLFFLFDQLWIALPTGVIVLVALIWYFILVRSHPQVAQRTKRAAWIFVFYVLVILGRMYFLLADTGL